MIPKERVQLALSHRQPDIIPYQFSFTRPAAQKMTEAWGKDYADRLGNHLIYAEAIPSDGWQEITPDFWRDEWGVVWNRTVDKDIGVPDGDVLPEPSLEGFSAPDPDAPGRFDALKETLAQHGDRFVLFAIGFSLFERAWALRGMERFLMDLVLHPDFAGALLDTIADYDLALIERALAQPIDAVHLGDDWGQQRGLIMGPVHWRRTIKSRLARIVDRVKKDGRRVSIHSCGDITAILPDLMEIGVDLVNPFQPDIMDVYAIKARHGNRLSFWGGLSVQHLLPHGTPGQVRAEVRRLIREVGAGGGYILAPSHDIPGDVPVENMIAAIEEAQAQTG
jgi:uroporphyrinogen decarboxylase